MREAERMAESLRAKQRAQAAIRAAELVRQQQYEDAIGLRVKDVIASASDIAQRAAQLRGKGLAVDEMLIERGFYSPNWLRSQLPASWPVHQKHAAWILKPCHPNTSYGPQDPTIYTDEDLQGVGLLTDGRIAVFEEPRHIVWTLDELVAEIETAEQPSWSRNLGSRCGQFETLLSEFDVNRIK